MIKIVGSILLFGFLINLSGCSSSARPQFIRGGYFLTGDDDCWSSSRRTYNTINCYNKKDELVGYREEMTDEELQEYRHKETQKAQPKQNYNNQTSDYNYQIPNYNYQPQLRQCSTLNGLTHCW